MEEVTRDGRCTDTDYRRVTSTGPMHTDSATTPRTDGYTHRRKEFAAAVFYIRIGMTTLT